VRVFAGSPARDAPARSTWFRATTARTIEATAPSSKAVAGTGKLHKEIVALVSSAQSRVHHCADPGRSSARTLDPQLRRRGPRLLQWP
jgi:hypothetical protein